MNQISPISYLNIEDLNQHVNSSTPFVLIFLSEWCPACQEYKAIAEFFAEKIEKKISTYVLKPENVDDNIWKLLELNKIDVIPYTLFFLGKTTLAEVPGAMRFYDYETAIKTIYKTFL